MDCGHGWIPKTLLRMSVLVILMPFAMQTPESGCSGRTMTGPQGHKDVTATMSDTHGMAGGAGERRTPRGGEMKLPPAEPSVSLLTLRSIAGASPDARVAIQWPTNCYVGNECVKGVATGP